MIACGRRSWTITNCVDFDGRQPNMSPFHTYTHAITSSAGRAISSILVLVSGQKCLTWIFILVVVDRGRFSKWKSNANTQHGLQAQRKQNTRSTRTRQIEFRRRFLSTPTQTQVEEEVEETKWKIKQTENVQLSMSRWRINCGRKLYVHLVG